MRIHFIYFIHIIVTPLLLSLICASIMMGTGEQAGPVVSLLIFLLGGLAAGNHYGKKMTPAGVSFGSRYFHVYLPLFIVTFVCAVLMVITGGFFGNDVWAVYIYLVFPFLPYTFFNVFMGQFVFAFLAPFLFYSLFLAGFAWKERDMDAKSRIHWGMAAGGLAAIFVSLSISGYVMYERSKTILPPSYGFEYGNGYSSVDLDPYKVTTENNQLPVLEDSASFLIEHPDEMPVLDGAEAAFPVYSAFANAVYQDIAEVNVVDDEEKIVSFYNTIYAFERLLSGEVDIFFGAQPSAAQQQLAESKGKELVLTPIGKEAFVFFVNKDNPVHTLNSDDLRGIYSGAITNWSEVGGEDGKIVAFQRPADSGSQTIMEKFMGETPLMDPLKEEILGMGDIIEQVADYRNYENSLGYSFRFFTTGMNPNDDIQLLSLDGIEPSAENIASGKYPFVVNLYAITVKDNEKKTIQPMLEWMQGEQGQKLVEEVGYIPLDGE